MSNSLELVLDAKAVLAEGPCWDARDQLLYWVDILGKKVHIFNPADHSDRSIEISQFAGCVVLGKPGTLLVALRHGFHFLDAATGQLTSIHDPEPHLPGSRFNDGKCDIKGRFWAGTMDMEESKPVGSLYRMDTNLQVSRVLDGITVSNGITWSPDSKTMYYIDSPTKRVVAFDFNVDSGTVSNPRTVVVIPKDGGFPDGMTSDEEGMLWVAQWDGWQVSRWNPHTGELLQVIPVPAARTSSCVFGGRDLDELYITTARIGISEKELENQPHAGSIFRIKTGVRGLPSYRFEGR